MTDSHFEPGSFRDRTSRVFYRDGAVLRGLNAHAAQEWEVLNTKPFFQQFMTAGKLVQTEQVEPRDKQWDEQWTIVLKHRAIPFISYPYEWPFSMLQDAALLTLELQAAALRADMTLKDATPFNVQWSGSQPVFIDIPRSSVYGPANRGSATASSVNCFSIHFFCKPTKTSPFSPGCVAIWKALSQLSALSSCRSAMSCAQAFFPMSYSRPKPSPRTRRQTAISRKIYVRPAFIRR